MKMLEDEEDPFIPSPSEARRFRRLDKMPEHERLKATVRMFLDAIWWVPMRAVDCDQLLVEQLWIRLCKETKPSRKNTQDQQPRTKEAAHMSDENERSVASAGSVAGGDNLIDRLSELSGDVGRWGGKTICEAIDEIERLRLAIRRLADQNATLSVCDGNVTVTMDATLTDEERQAVEFAVARGETVDASWRYTLRGLLERTK